MATLHATLGVFERSYVLVVGKRYAELDEALAALAEAETRFNPTAELRARAARAVDQARETREAVSAASPVSPAEPCDPDELRRLYRTVTRAVHPDLADNDDDRRRRHDFMARVNRAYESGSVQQLKEILRDWESSPESVQGGGVGSELVRMIRKISRVLTRLEAIDAEIRNLMQSSLYAMKSKADEAERGGRDLLAETAAHVATEIAGVHERISMLNQRVRP